MAKHYSGSLTAKVIPLKSVRAGRRAYSVSVWQGRRKVGSFLIPAGSAVFNTGHGRDQAAELAMANLRLQKPAMGKLMEYGSHGYPVVNSGTMIEPKRIRRRVKRRTSR